jgi:hypothetical protein
MTQISAAYFYALFRASLGAEKLITINANKWFLRFTHVKIIHFINTMHYIATTFNGINFDLFKNQGMLMMNSKRLNILSS